jgi:hypothetical protein
MCDGRVGNDRRMMNDSEMKGDNKITTTGTYRISKV